MDTHDKIVAALREWDLLRPTLVLAVTTAVTLNEKLKAKRALESARSAHCNKIDILVIRGKHGLD